MQGIGEWVLQLIHERSHPVQYHTIPKLEPPTLEKTPSPRVPLWFLGLGVVEQHGSLSGDVDVSLAPQRDFPGHSTRH